MNDFDHIKSIPILQVAADLCIKVNKYNKSLCFFHNEKTPSMSFNTKRNYFYCFSCNKGGSVIDLVNHFLNLNISDSIKYLKNKYYKGIFMDETVLQINKAIKEFEISPERRIDIYETFVDQCYLVKNGASLDEEAKKYLLSRNLEEKTLRKMRIFSVYEYSRVNNFLKQSFPEDELRASGLASEKGNLLFFDHKIIFPYVHDGSIVNLRGRTIGNNPNKSKYLGLKGISSKMFYNIDILKTLRPFDTIIITEGEIDCISLVQNGKNAIAIPGVTNIPPMSEWEKLQHFNIEIAFDNDNAGIKAISDIKKVFDELRKKFKIIKIDSKDINELINRE